MIKDNNSLMNQPNQSIFKKIAKWFKNLFHLNKNKMLASSSKSYSEEEKQYNNSNSSNLIEEDENINTAVYSNVDKDEFFELYNNIKNQSVNAKDLQPEELIQFNIMAEKEIEIKRQKLEKLRQGNAILKNENQNLERERIELQEKVNSDQKGHS